jgi:hypothetical protein
MILKLNDIIVPGIVGDIVTSISANNLKDISTRNGAYTNNFKVPITNVTRQIVDSAEVVVSFAGNAYKKLKAEIIIEDLTIVNGFAVLEDTKDEYSFRVFSGNTSFNNAIKSLELTDIEAELNLLDHEHTYANVFARRSNTDGLIYPNIDYGWLEYFTGSLRRLDWKWVYPSVYAAYILDAAIRKLGYNKSGSFWNSSDYKDFAVPCLGIVQSDFAGFVDYSYSFQKGFITGDSKQISFPVKNSDTNNLYQDSTIGSEIIRVFNFPEPVTSDTKFKLELTGKINVGYRMVYGLPLEHDTTYAISLEIRHKGTNVFIGNFYDAQFRTKPASFFFKTFGLNEVITDPSNINLIDSTNHVLIWRLRSVSGSQTNVDLLSFDNVNFKLTQYKEDVEFSGISIINSLPKIKIADLFKAILNINGVFFIVDETEKTIRAIYLNEIIQNKSKAYDWSDKIDLSESPELKYRMDEYGQNSIFNYENEEGDKWLDANPKYFEGILNMPDETLPLNTNLIEVPFSPVYVGLTANRRTAMGKIFTGDKYVFDGLAYNLDPNAKVQKFEKRLVKLVNSQTDIRITDNLAADGTQKFSREVTESISFDKVIPERYGLIKSIGSQTKIITQAFRLNASDIYNFDFSRPVYVAYFGEYFFVNEIKQFKLNKNESTDVELIRI